MPWMPVLTNKLLSYSTCQLEVSKHFVIINRFSFLAPVRDSHLCCKRSEIGSGGEMIREYEEN